MRKSLELALSTLANMKPSDGGYEEIQYIKAAILEEDKPSLSEQIKVIHPLMARDIVSTKHNLKDVESIDKIFIGSTLVRRRSYVEHNSRCFIQPIGYVAIYNPKLDSFFMLRKINGSNEARLHGKWGFVGGHWNHSFDRFSESIIDEVSSEIKFECLDDEQTKGYILANLVVSDMVLFEDKPGSVESDHLGIVYILVTDRADLSSKEMDKNEGQFISRKALENSNYNLESWADKVVKCFDILK